MSDVVPPEVTVRGPGDPEVAVVGGVHGDETGGVRAVRRLREADLDLQRGVVFVVAHPEAVEEGVRYLDSDLNRVFPGDPDGDREQRLAARLCEHVESVATLSIHGTHSEPRPFALVHRSQPREFDVASGLPVPYVVDHSGVNEGTITTCGLVVEVEVGPQGTDAAAASAERQARAFLERMDALPGEPPDSDPPDADPPDGDPANSDRSDPDRPDADPEYFHMTAPITKPPDASYGLYVRNFERVPEGAVWGRVGDRELVAEEPFYPILMSVNGYPDIFGYRGRKLGDALSEVREVLAVPVE